MVATSTSGSTTSQVATLTVADCVPKPDGLVAWWTGDGTAMDVVGTNRGTLQGGVTYASGMAGQAFSFDGVNSFVQLPQNLFPFPTSGVGAVPFSFEFWFKTSSGGVILGQQTTSPFQNPSSYVPAIYVGTDNKLHVEMFFTGTADLITSASSVNDGVFHYVAVTYDGSTESVYLDGVLSGSKPWTQVAYDARYNYQLGTGFTQGWPAGNGGWYSLNGVIDEPSLYNRALSPDEVASIYSAGCDGKCFTNDPAPIFAIQPVSQTGYTLNSVVPASMALRWACHVPATCGTLMARRLQKPRAPRLRSPICLQQMPATTFWSPPAPREQPPARWQP